MIQASSVIYTSVIFTVFCISICSNFGDQVDKNTAQNKICIKVERSEFNDCIIPVNSYSNTLNKGLIRMMFAQGNTNGVLSHGGRIEKVIQYRFIDDEIGLLQQWTLKPRAQGKYILVKSEAKNTSSEISCVLNLGVTNSQDKTCITFLKNGWPIATFAPMYDGSLFSWNWAEEPVQHYNSRVKAHHPFVHNWVPYNTKKGSPEVRPHNASFRQIAHSKQEPTSSPE